MKVTLYNAISADGFIATPEGDSDWVSEEDWPGFEAAMKENGCIVVGRTTFEQFLEELYPLEGITNIVMTSDPEKTKEEGDVIYTSETPHGVLELAADMGHESVLLIGGGTTNASFMEAELIDEIRLTIHPLILGSGIRLFESDQTMLELERLNVHELKDGLIHVTYSVLHS